MGISIAEFRTALEEYGAKRLPDDIGTRFSVPVPCFNVNGVIFKHSGSYYIVKRGEEVPDEVMDRAMAEFGEKHPGGRNYWWGEIHSVEGILTLASMLDGKYSKELVNELTNRTYKKLLECSLIQENVDLPERVHKPNMEKLFRKVSEFDNAVNPFMADYDMKDPEEYFNRVRVAVDVAKDDTLFAALSIYGKSFQTIHDIDSDGWYFTATADVQKNRKNGYITIGHLYNNGNDHRPVDECVWVNYKTKRHTYHSDPTDIRLTISLSTGLAWTDSDGRHTAPVSDEQLRVMIIHINEVIKKLHKRAIRYMITR